MSLSIIIPCRNEDKNIESTVSEILKFLKNRLGEFEINIINDFSTDNTLSKIKKISEVEKKVKIYNNQVKGLGGAINLGLKHSSYKYITVVMADSSDYPVDILNYYNEINNNELDAVLGSRFISGSQVENYPKIKLFFNRIFNYLVKILFWHHYNDFTNSFKIYRTDVLKEIKPFVSENFNIFLELPLKIINREYKYSIIPINWKNRKLGNAKFKIKELSSKYLFTLFYCFLEKILLNKKRGDE
jgi:dolichol-phosphate mannosyltransferase